MLTQLQGKAGLLRQLGFVSATALVVSNMVGMGIFTTTGFMARDLGSAKLILAVSAHSAVAPKSHTMSISNHADAASGQSRTSPPTRIRQRDGPGGEVLL